MEENSPSNRRKCSKCEKTISLFESDFSPDHAEWRHIDGSGGHEIDASRQPIRKKSFWNPW